jgi:hypothetical protein
MGTNLSHRSDRTPKLGIDAKTLVSGSHQPDSPCKSYAFAANRRAYDENSDCPTNSPGLAPLGQAKIALEVCKV